eukprot:g442.t1
MRLDRPIGVSLLLWPGYWSLALASAHVNIISSHSSEEVTKVVPTWPMQQLLTNPDNLHSLLPLMLKFGVGAVIMRGAGCTINDILDRDIDSKVARTRERPLASGQLTLTDAVMFLGLQLTGGLLILLTMNPFAIKLGTCSVPLVLTYPLFKRFSNWPQLMLGLTFNWGALLGWAAYTGDIAYTTILPLYLGCVSWTLVYDTIYALQDREDDRKLGLRSTALTFGSRTREYLSAFGLFTFGCWTLTGLQVFNGDLFTPYMLGTTLASSHMAYQIATVETQEYGRNEGMVDKETAEKHIAERQHARENQNARFTSNTAIGYIMFAGILLSHP